MSASSLSPSIHLLLACEQGIASRIRQHLATSLGNPVCRCIESKSELLAALDDRAWDLMICALQLDDTTALDAVKQIQLRGLHMPVILLAETGVEDISLHCLEEGVDQYIPPTPHGFQRLPVLVRTLSDRTASERKRLQTKDELKESRDRYLDVFDNTSDLIQCLAADGTFLYTNRAWREAMGYTEDEVRSLTLMEVLHPDS